MGPVEWIFNTPSHHRVHHGKNPKYIDKNYGGTLIIWDRLFGTFQIEEEEPLYGITKPLQSWNPIWANFHYLVDLVRMTWQTKYWSDKILVWFKPPAWKPRDLRDLPRSPRPPLEEKFDTPIPWGMSLYTFVHFLVILLATTFLLYFSPWLVKYNLLLLLITSMWVLLSLSSFGGIFESRRWVLLAEPVRLLAGVAILGYLVYETSWFWPTLSTSLVGAVASMGWFWGYLGVFAPPSAEDPATVPVK